MSVEATESESAANAVAPRVSLDDIKGAIVAEYWSTADRIVEQALTHPIHPSLKIMTIYVCVMKNGFVVLGKSAPASPENFNVELGRKLAKEDAIRQLWPLMGFSLRDRLAA